MGYVQDERYIAGEHMEVRRDCVSFARLVVAGWVTRYAPLFNWFHEMNSTKKTVGNKLPTRCQISDCFNPGLTQTFTYLRAADPL